MKKGNILFLTLLIFTILAFSYQPTFSESALDRRFPRDIAQSPLPKLLDFGRGECIPCKKMAPILKELSEEYKDRVIIKIIEIDQEMNLTEANRIRLIPTQIFFDAKNREVLRHEGFMGKERYQEGVPENGGSVSHGNPSQSSLPITQRKPLSRLPGSFRGRHSLLIKPLRIGHHSARHRICGGILGREIAARPCSIL